MKNIFLAIVIGLTASCNNPSPSNYAKQLVECINPRNFTIPTTEINPNGNLILETDKKCPLTIEGRQVLRLIGQTIEEDVNGISQKFVVFSVVGIDGNSYPLSSIKIPYSKFSYLHVSIDKNGRLSLSGTFGG